MIKYLVNDRPLSKIGFKNASIFRINGPENIVNRQGVRYIAIKSDCSIYRTFMINSLNHEIIRSKSNKFRNFIHKFPGFSQIANFSLKKQLKNLQ